MAKAEAGVEARARVDLAGTMPAGDLNGWQAEAAALVRLPKRRRMAVIEFDCLHVKVAKDDGTDEPVVRVLQVEVAEDGGDVETMLRNLMNERYAARGGQLNLDGTAGPLQDER